MIVNKRQLSDVMCVTEQMLTIWQRDGMPIEAIGGPGMENQYNTGRVIGWRINRAVAGKSKMTPQDEYYFHRAREKEMDIAERAGLLVSVEEVGPLWEGAILAARADLLGMGPRLKATIDARYGIDVDIAMIESEIHHALTKLGENPPAVDDEKFNFDDGAQDTTAD